MAIVFAKVKTEWTGTSGGPGVTQMAFQGINDPHTWDAAAAQRVVDAVRKMWVACATGMPDNIKLQVSPVVDVLNAADGELVGSYTAATTPAVVVGSDTGSFAMASGIRVRLNTGQILNGRRVKGAVFIVPVGFACFDTNGGVVPGTRTIVNNAFNQINTDLLASNEQLAVWSRPIPEGKPHGPRDGHLTPVTNCDASPKGAILKGRRD